MDLKRSLEEQVSAYAQKDYVSVAINDTVASAARAMKKAEAGEALVVQGGEPIGIVTERDILFKVVAAGRDPSSTSVEQVMSTPVEGVGEDAKVADAIAKMSSLGVRRLVVRRGKKAVGLITQKMVTGGNGSRVALPELVRPSGVTCPYCSAVLADAKELSKHIDGVHVGEGLLRGDRRKW